jgi:adenylate isopentenyltransferase (cytokinin synthase)
MVSDIFQQPTLRIVWASSYLTGKSDFPAEIVNSDKMQVYNGLDIVTNKVTEEQCRGVPHHLLGIFDPNTNFTVNDFLHHAPITMELILI